jgi:hypothetical protein
MAVFCCQLVAGQWHKHTHLARPCMRITDILSKFHDTPTCNASPPSAWYGLEDRLLKLHSDCCLTVYPSLGLNMRCQPEWDHPVALSPSLKQELNYAASLWWPTGAAPSQSLREASGLHCANELAEKSSLHSAAQVLLVGPAQNTPRAHHYKLLWVTLQYQSHSSVWYI